MRKILVQMLRLLAEGMAAEVLIAAVLAFFFPEQVSRALPMKIVPWLLGAVMFGMGLTLRARDFLPVLTHPREVVVGFAAQFAVMPLVAVALVKLLYLPPELALGVVLVGCAPGGTASNVISYLARGDVALSVAMTSCSTLAAPFATPFLVWICAATQTSIRVDAMAMALSTAKVVLAPVALGVLVNEGLPRVAQKMTAAMPAFSAFVVSVIVAAVVAVNAVAIRAHAGLALVAVVLHNLCGMGLGWGVARLCRLSAAKCRTLAIEVGMQNSGLAVSLAALHFAQFPLATVPGALFSVWHNLSGSLFATICRRADRRFAGGAAGAAETERV